MFRSASLLILTFIVAAASLLPAARAENPPQLLLEWGSRGSGDGQFSHPTGIAVDAVGNVYVTETADRSEPSNHRIQKFTSNGTFITKWGSLGSGDGQFDGAHGIAVDANGNVYVADTFNNRIQKFTSSGTFLAKWDSFGSGDGQFGSNPHGIGVDANGNFYVADTGNHRIQKFDSNGTFLTKWGSFGSGDGQFNQPIGAAFDSSGNVYVVDHVNHRIQKFTSNGTFLTKWGSGDGDFNGGPRGVAVDASDNVYVTDANRIQKFTSNGTFITMWGAFFNAWDVEVDASGSYAVDRANHRIQKFRPATLTVAIDIKPGSDPNSINLGSSGVIPAAILSSNTFNATTELNPNTLTLAGARVRVAGRSGNTLCHNEDVNSDGLLDLVCQFENDLNAELGDSIAALEGETTDGTPIRGEDSIRIVPDN